MRTKKPIATISYNSISFLDEKLNSLFEQKKISDYMYIVHEPEEDEKKKHIHLYIEPNTLLDTMELQDFFKELDLNNPGKPLKCINFVQSKIDDWILYNSHNEAYLASKFETRVYHYTKEDFYCLDSDTFDYNWTHAFKGSDWAKRNQMLEQLTDGRISPVKLITNGTIPLNMASQLNAFEFLKRNQNTTNRGSHNPHE